MRPIKRPDRLQWRRILLLAGVLPALAALAFTVLVVRFLAVQHSGNEAYADQRYLDAAGDYRSAGHHNPFEDWIAAFDAGAARHTAGQLHSAQSAYEAALKLGVPHRDECTVRINLALVHETLGDRAAKKGRLNAAHDEYQQGIAALEDGKCPTDSGRGADQTKDAKTVDDRLHKKDQQNKQQQQKKKQQQQQQQNNKKNKDDKKKSDQQKQQERKRRQQQKREEKRREKKLEQRNQQGLEDRKEQQGKDEGFGYQPNW